jgi:hypothetical protein
MEQRSGAFSARAAAASNNMAVPLSACIDQRRDTQSLRTFPLSAQPPYSTIDHTHYGAFPATRIPHRDFTHERRHFVHKANRQTSEEKEQNSGGAAPPPRRRIEPKFTSLDDRPHGTRQLREEDVYAAAKLRAAATEARGCRHFAATTTTAAAGAAPSLASIANLGRTGPSRDFITGGKFVSNKAQHTSSRETPLEETFGRIARLSEAELHERYRLARTGGGVDTPIEYSLNFYKTGACVPAVDWARSRAAKTAFGFQQMGLKDKRISEQLWRQTRGRSASSAAVDARKHRSYAEAEAERVRLYEERLVFDLPDEVRPPLEEEYAPPAPAVVVEDPVALLTPKERRAREKAQQLLSKQKSLATH